MNSSSSGPLQQYLDDPAVREIVVNSSKVWVWFDGALKRVVDLTSAEEALQFAESFAEAAGVEFSAEHPLQTFRLADGTKVSLIHMSVGGRFGLQISVIKPGWPQGSSEVQA